MDASIRFIFSGDYSGLIVWNTVLLVFLGGLGASVLVRFAYQLGVVLGVIDDPTRGHAGNALNHKRHDRPTPAVGGVILGITGLAAILVHATISSPSARDLHNIFLLAAAVYAAMIMGFFDDRAHIPAIKRLSISVLVFSALTWAMPDIVLHEVPFHFLGVVLPLGSWGVPFTIACIVGFQNAVNMADGKNGLLLGLAMFWLLHFRVHAPSDTIPLLWGFFAILLVLFYANVRGMLFMGNAGSYGIATFFAIFTLYLYGSPDPSFWHLEAPGIVLTFLLPCLDLFRLIAVRLVEGKSPFTADNDHLHHHLDARMGWRRGWFVYMALATAPAAIYHYLQLFPALIIGSGILAYALVLWWAKRAGKRSDAEAIAEAGSARLPT